MPETDKAKAAFLRSLLNRRVRVKSCRDNGLESWTIFPVEIKQTSGGSLYLKAHELGGSQAWSTFLWSYFPDDYEFEVIE